MAVLDAVVNNAAWARRHAPISMRGRRCLMWLMLPAVVLVTACGQRDDTAMRSGAELSTGEFEQLNMDWRERRLDRLTEPHGWLSLVGFVTLEPDSTITVGKSPDNDVVVSGGPRRWGTVRVAADGEVYFAAAEGAAVTIDGEQSATARMTQGRGDEAPTQVEAAGIRMHLVSPGGRTALRIRDPQAATRTGFAGLDYYPLDPDWRIEAEFIPHPDGTTMPVANVMGQVIEEPNPGTLRFTHQGKTITLEAVLEDDKLFVIFADRTSGRETYGLGRFLYARLPRDNSVILDFNQAYNPPCAFNAYTTCPLPPQSNRVDAWIRAGEKKYAGKPGIEHVSPR
ncbi:MAG: DUF1684 domain-containing protein [Wenzhouxiangellaceae bacterium]